MPPKFFITHSWKDIEFTKKLCNDLRANGLDGFFDAYSIQPGDDIPARITQGLAECDIYVPVLSPDALKSRWSELEINAAITLNRERGCPRIIPVIVKTCDIPILLRPTLYINFVGRYDDALNDLLTKGFGLPAKPPQVPEIEHLYRQGLNALLSDRLEEAVMAFRRVVAIDPNYRDAPLRLKDAERLLERTRAPILGEFTSRRPTLTIPRRSAMAGALALLLLIVWIGGQFSASLAPTPTRVALVTTAPSRTSAVISPTAISTLSVTPRPTVLTPIPTLGIGSAAINATDGATMMYIPSGEFAIGSTDQEIATALAVCTGTCRRDWSNNEQPQHPVLLDAYWIDKYEVTNALYKKCVDAGKCAAPTSTRSATRSLYFGSSAFSNYPVLYVSWNDAKDYCDWAGKRLPTEAEWERVARGTDRRIFPWGSTFDTSRLNSVESKNADTTEVGAYPAGASPYGVMDMAGNVWEWVADWYVEDYYAGSPRKNPTGPSAGRERVLRGGTWGVELHMNRSAARNRMDPTLNGFGIGFRCAKNAMP